MDKEIILCVTIDMYLSFLILTHVSITRQLT